MDFVFWTRKTLLFHAPLQKAIKVLNNYTKFNATSSTVDATARVSVCARVRVRAVSGSDTERQKRRIENVVSRFTPGSRWGARIPHRQEARMGFVNNDWVAHQLPRRCRGRWYDVTVQTDVARGRRKRRRRHAE